MAVGVRNTGREEGRAGTTKGSEADGGTCDRGERFNRRDLKGRGEDARGLERGLRKGRQLREGNTRRQNPVGRHEQVFAYKGPVGMGIAAFRTGSQEAQQLRSELHSLRRKKQKMMMDGIEYQVRVEVFDSFGEDAYRVIVKKC